MTETLFIEGIHIPGRKLSRDYEIYRRSQLRDPLPTTIEDRTTAAEETAFRYALWIARRDALVIPGYPTVLGYDWRSVREWTAIYPATEKTKSWHLRYTDGGYYGWNNPPPPSVRLSSWRPVPKREMRIRAVQWYERGDCLESGGLWNGFRERWSPGELILEIPIPAWDMLSDEPIGIIRG